MRTTCYIIGCDKEAFSKELCQRHYTQIWRHGKIFEKTRSDPNDFIKKEDHFEIILRNRFGVEIARALIDKEDYQKVRPIKWHYDATYGYVNGKDINGNKFRLHRLIMSALNGLDIDHKRRGKESRLDCRKNNLRHATRSENKANVGLTQRNNLVKRELVGIQNGVSGQPR